MARHKRHNKNFGKPRVKKVEMKKQSIVKKKKGIDDDVGTIEISDIKLALNSIIRPNSELDLTNIFFEKSLNATKIQVLASLLMLFKVNEAIDNENVEFFTGNGTVVIRDNFNSVTVDNIEDPNTAQMPAEFHTMVNQWSPDFIWPKRHQMTKVVYAQVDQYKSNMKTNLETWCWPRLTYFLRLKCYEFNHGDERPLENHTFDDIDIRNTMKNLMLNEDWTDGDENRKMKMKILFQEVRVHGGPSFDNHLTVKKYIQIDWFESLWMWVRIQRIIAEFLTKTTDLRRDWKKFSRDPHNNSKPLKPKLPDVRNFAAVPLSDTQLKHIKFDNDDLINLIGQLNKSKVIDIRHDYRTHYKNEENKNDAWDILFDMNKIRQLRTGSKEFYYRIKTNSVSVSVSFSRPRRKGAGVSFEQIKEKYNKCVEEGGYAYEAAIDPGEKTKVACVRRNLTTKVETNIKLSSKHYQWGARQGLRDKYAMKMTSRYTHNEQRDLKSYRIMPSPRGPQWKSFIEHKTKMLCDGLATYTRRKYTQLKLNRYIQSNRESDESANYITKNLPSCVFMGDATMPANSPIGIKKQKRCPKQRKLVVSLKKSGNTNVVFTPEPYTSQTCPNCLRRFPKNTKSHRFKVCKDCKPYHPHVNLPSKIMTDRSRRRCQRDRKRLANNESEKSQECAKETRAEKSHRHRENRRIARKNVDPLQNIDPNDAEALKRYNRRERWRKVRKQRRIAGRRVARHRNDKTVRPKPELPAVIRMGDVVMRYLGERRKAKKQVTIRLGPRPQPNDTGEGKLGSKKIIFEKNWHLSPPRVQMGDADTDQQCQQQPACTVVWHRDICAAKCILYVGRCLVFGWTVHESFVLSEERKRPSIREKQSKPTCRTDTVDD